MSLAATFSRNAKSLRIATLVPASEPNESSGSTSGDGHCRRRLEAARVKHAVAERERPLALEVGVADAHAVELRPVERAVVLHAPAGLVAGELAVKARHRRVEEHEIVAGMCADAAHRALVDDDARLAARLAPHLEGQLGDDIDAAAA